MSERQFEAVTFVGVFDSAKVVDPAALGPADVESIESSMDATVSIGQGASSHGAGFAIAIQALQLDALFFGNRVEVRSTKREFTEDVASNIRKLFVEVYPKVVHYPWIRTGYNYILRSDLETAAVSKVKDYFFRTDLAELLGDPVKEVTGGAAWVWLDVGDDIVWLRLQPHRDNPASSRIVLNANISKDLATAEDFPEPETIETQLWQHWQTVDKILRGVGI